MLAVTALLGVGIIVAAYFGSQMLSKQAQKLVSLKLNSKVADTQQTSLLQAKKDIKKYAELGQEAKAIVPQEKDQAATVREIVTIAAANHMKLGAITFPASSLGQSLPVSSAPATPQTPKVPPVTQVQPVAGIDGVYVMPITIQSDSSSPVTYSNLIEFLNGLEHSRRTAQVSSVTITPDRQDQSKLSFSLIVNVYLKP